MRTYALRLHPGQDLRKEIDQFVAMQKIQAGCILTCVGNLSKAVIRMADATITKTYEESLEIVSLVGTVEVGNSHLHISLANADGQVVGGHLKEGTLVGTTAEIVIGALENSRFKREFDNQTGYKELIVE